MGFLGFFRSKSFNPEEFEQELTALTQAISQNRETLSALSAKSRAWRRSLLIYCSVIYVSYVVYRYKACCDNLGILGHGKSRFSKFVSGQSPRELATVVLFPVAIALVVYMVGFLFRVLISSKNKNLRSLLKQHREKVEELKNVTNFSRTNQILQKFDGPASQKPEPAKEGEKSTSDKKGAKQAPAGKPASSKPSIPPTANVPGVAKKTALDETEKRPNLPGPTQKAATPKPRPSSAQVPAQISFQDRILDFIIGSDHNENVENRYALICDNCYTHNGLAPPGCKNPNSVTYICRHCGYINGEISTHPKEGLANHTNGIAEGSGKVSPRGTESTGSENSAQPVEVKVEQ